MDPLFTRPRVADLVYRLYDRPLPADLYDTLAERTVRRGDFALTVRLTPAGHALEWRRGNVHLTELTAAADWPLPAGDRLAHPFVGERRGRLTLGGVRYEVGLQAEVLPAEVFAHVHDDLAALGERKGLLHRYAPHHRVGLTPLGLVTVEPLPTGLSVATFHTFPGELAVVKTQSLIEG